MRKLLLLLFLTAFIEADAQFFNGRSALEQWRDSVIHSVRLTPIVSLKNLSFSQFSKMPERSIMFQQESSANPVNPLAFRLGSLRVMVPIPLNRSYYDDEDETLGEALLMGILETTLDILFTKPPKPCKKELVKKRISEY
ncbi:MAG: hypothetical protein IKW78_02725 [Prevotella sp.]|nr:hypothetical protein [Prevotella sp.]MBR6016763.1 hypothetical protein [Prevotella sp.]